MITIVFVSVLCERFFFFKQKTAYEMRISDWSSDVCSSDLHRQHPLRRHPLQRQCGGGRDGGRQLPAEPGGAGNEAERRGLGRRYRAGAVEAERQRTSQLREPAPRSEARRVGKEGVSTCRSRWSQYH